MPRLRSALTLSEVEVSTVLLGKQKPIQTPWESPASGFSVETLRIDVRKLMDDDLFKEETNL